MYRERVLGETNKHPPRYARVVRLVSLRRLSNFFDSLKRAFCLRGSVLAVGRHKQAGDGAQGRDTHQRVDDAAEHTGGTAEQPGHQVEAEQAHKAPVQTAHDQQQNADLIKNRHVFSSFSGLSLPRFWGRYTNRAGRSLPSNIVQKL